MKINDKQFEAFLREFDLLQPRSLPLPVAPASIWRRRLAAAAVVVLVGSTALWLASRGTHEVPKPEAKTNMTPLPEESRTTQRLPLLQLTRLAQNDPERLDAALEEESRSLLPGFEEKDSTLAELAKE